jgi:hypothetical protein
MVAPGVAGARHTLGARTILPRTIAVGTLIAAARETRPIAVRPASPPIVPRLAAERSIAARAIVAIEVATRRPVAVPFEIKAWRPITIAVEIAARRPVAIAAERAAPCIVTRTSLGGLFAAILAWLEVALRTIAAIEVRAWRAVTVPIEVAARRPIPVLPERVPRRVPTGPPVIAPLAAAIVARAVLALRAVLAIEVAARGAVAVLFESAALAPAVRTLLAEALAAGALVAKAPGRGTIAAALAARSALAVLAKRAACTSLSRVEAAAFLAVAASARLVAAALVPALAARRGATPAGRTPVVPVVVAGHGKRRLSICHGMI